MPEHHQQLVRCAPYFPAADVARAVTYYERVFGFTREYLAGDPPVFAIVARDSIPIMLRLVSDATAIVPNERQGGTWDAFFWVRDVRALCDEMRAHGAEIVYGPVFQQAYGMTEFAVRDVDGHVLGFGQPVAPA